MYDLPRGLPNLLEAFTMAVLREEPADIVDFAVIYFTNLYEEMKRSEEKDTHGHGQKTNFAAGPFHYADFADGLELDQASWFPKSPSVGSHHSAASFKVVYPKTSLQKEALKYAMKDITIFQTLSLEQHHDVIDAMFTRCVKANEQVIKEGDKGETFYVIESGSFSIYVKRDGEMKAVGSYEGEGNFGELALRYHVPYAATVIAKTDGKLWGLDRQTFRQILLRKKFQKHKRYETILESIPVLQMLKPCERVELANALQSKDVEDGSFIYRQGDIPNGMFFIESGKVVISIKDMDNAEVDVNVLDTGAYFGEMALINQGLRAESAKAVGQVELAYLSPSDFQKHLLPYAEILRYGRAPSSISDEHISCCNTMTPMSGRTAGTG